MKTKKMMALVLAGMAVCSQVRGQQTMTINGQTVILSNMKKNGVSTTDAEAAKVLGDGLRSFGVVKPGDTVVVGDQNATTESNQAKSSMPAGVPRYDAEHAKQVFIEGKPLYAWCDESTKVATHPGKYTVGPFFIIASPQTKEPVPFGLTWNTDKQGMVSAVILQKLGPVSSTNAFSFFVDLPKETSFYRPEEKPTLKNRPVRIKSFINRGDNPSDWGYELEVYVDVAHNRVARLVENTQPLPLYLYPFGDAAMEWNGTLNEVRVRNPNEFAVTAGFRSGKQGRNLSVPAGGVRSVFVPNGKFDVYFVYSSKPDALFQGDSFTLNNNGVEIQIVKVVAGNYNIRQVK